MRTSVYYNDNFVQVTLAAMLTGYISIFKGLMYMLFQVAGGILGSFVLVSRQIAPLPLLPSLNSCQGCLRFVTLSAAFSMHIREGINGIVCATAQDIHSATRQRVCTKRSPVLIWYRL